MANILRKTKLHFKTPDTKLSYNISSIIHLLFLGDESISPGKCGVKEWREVAALDKLGIANYNDLIEAPVF